MFVLGMHGSAFRRGLVGAGGSGLQVFAGGGEAGVDTGE
jgi:hypothetical protein